MKNNRKKCDAHHGSDGGFVRCIRLTNRTSGQSTGTCHVEECLSLRFRAGACRPGRGRRDHSCGRQRAGGGERAHPRRQGRPAGHPSARQRVLAAGLALFRDPLPCAIAACRSAGPTRRASWPPTASTSRADLHIRGAATHEVVHCRHGTVKHSQSKTVSDQWCIARAARFPGLRIGARRRPSIYENRRTASTALRPPKAKEFDSAASTRIARASFGTQSRSQAGSGPR